jgi:hypothetical protein
MGYEELGVKWIKAVLGKPDSPVLILRTNPIPVPGKKHPEPQSQGSELGPHSIHMERGP